MTAETSSPKAPEGARRKVQVDVNGLAKMLGLTANSIRKELKLKSPTQIEIEKLQTLDDVRAFGWRNRFEDEDDKKSFVEHRFKLASSILKEAANTSLVKLVEVWGLVKNRIEGETWDIAGEFARLALDAAKDPKRRPQSYGEIQSVEHVDFGMEIVPILRNLRDEYIASEVRKGKCTLEGLCMYYNNASGDELRDEVADLVKSKVRNMNEACFIYMSIRLGGKSDRFSEFFAGWVGRTYHALKTLGEKKEFLRSREIENFLDAKTRYQLSVNLFRSFIQNYKLDEAREMLEHYWKDKDIRDSGFREKWNESFCNAYDKLHLDEIKGGLTVEELMKKETAAPSNSLCRKRCTAFIRTRVLKYIKAASDLGSLNEVMSSYTGSTRYLNHDDMASLEEKRNGFIQREFSLARSEGDYLMLWGKLTSIERRDWKPKIILAILPFHTIEETEAPDLVELPA